MIISGTIIFLCLFSWPFIIVNWRRGVILTLLYLPIGGYFTYRSNHHYLLVLAKDLLFILPTYLGFALDIRSGNLKVNAPKVILVSTLFIALLVVYHLINPYGPPLPVAIIGAKVWLFYMPFIFIGANLFNNPKEFYSFFWPVILISFVPVVFGLTLFCLYNLYGFREIAEIVYGQRVEENLGQTFRVYSFGVDFYSIISTFTFRSQYNNYLYLITCLSFPFIFNAQSKKRKSIALILIILAIIANLTSGSRGAYLGLPITFIILFFAKYKTKGIIIGSIVSIASVLIAGVIGIDLKSMYDHVIPRIQTQVIPYFLEIPKGLINAPLGLGTGSQTSSALNYANRLGFDLGQLSTGVFENYYWKVAIELGLLGFILFFAIVIYTLIGTLLSIYKTKEEEVRAISCFIFSYLCLVLIFCITNWAIDLEPHQIYFWLIIGLSLKISIRAKIYE